MVSDDLLLNAPRALCCDAYSVNALDRRQIQYISQLSDILTKRVESRLDRAYSRQQTKL